MATVFLRGFGHPDSMRLIEEMRLAAPQHQFENIDGQPPDQSDATSSIAMVWCPRSSEEAVSVVSETASSGLPAVALVQDGPIPPFDLSSGHVEVSFAPITCIEALKRIELVIARANGPADRNLITHGDLVIDQDRYEVLLAGNKIDLTYKEYELLKYIAARPGRVFSREALLRAVWDYDYFGGTRTVDVHVRRLRSKINDVRYQFIETVWNVGYRFRGGGEGQHKS